MEDLQIANSWKDKMLGDLKAFSDKKHKPVGMHHLIQEIQKLANPNKLIDISFTKFDKKKFINKSFFEKLDDYNLKVLNKLPIRLSLLNKKENLFTKEVKSVIVYAIPIPKSVFRYSIKDIYKYFDLVKQEKSNIDNNILQALAKYGYWGVPEGTNHKFLFGDFDKNAIFKSSNLGEISEDGFPLTSKNGPRIFVSYIITNAPLKVELDPPLDLYDNDECKSLKHKMSLNHLYYYRETFGLAKTLKDVVTSIIKDNRFGEYINYCYNSNIGQEYEINLLVKDPLDYKE